MMVKRKDKQKHEPALGDVALDQSIVEQTSAIAENELRADMPLDPLLLPMLLEPIETEPSIPEPSSPPPLAIAVDMADQAIPQINLSAASLMPRDPATCKVLEERALAIAKPISQQRYEQRAEYLRFRLGAVELYGIPYHYLDGLRYVGNLARVPCTPKFVAGVVNYRGELLTVLDLKQFFRMPALAQAGESRIIVVKHAGMRVGLLVDDVDGNEAYQRADLAPPLGSDGVTNMEYVLGIHDGCVALINIEALLKDPALRVMN